MLFDYFVNSFQIYLIIFIRLLGMFVASPFFSGGAMPFRFRLGFTFFVALVATPIVVGTGILQVPPDAAAFIGTLISNFVLGMGIGFFVYMAITAFQVSAQVFSIPMGLGMNEVMDPTSQMQIPALGNLLGVMAILIFFRVDGHFYLIQIVIDSFQNTQGLNFQSIKLLYDGMINGLILMFEIAIKIALPIIAVTLTLDMAMGLISRVAPQFNVMIMGFNIKILAGFIIIWLILPAVIDLGSGIISGIINSARTLIAAMGT